MSVCCLAETLKINILFINQIYYLYALDMKIYTYE